MIIDAHCHIVDTSDAILRRMDALGIDKTVLVGVSVKNLDLITIDDSFIFKNHFILCHFGMRKARKLLRSSLIKSDLLQNPQNEKVMWAVEKNSDRFYGFVFINPTSTDAIAIVKKYLDMGFLGIKLALQQYPIALNDNRIQAVLDLAKVYCVPVFIHFGLDHNGPEISQLIIGNPKVKFIIAHAGVQYFHLIVSLARDNQNIFFDTSSFFVTPKKLKILCGEIGTERLIFGSDFPVMAKDPSEAISKIENLGVATERKANILGENFAREFLKYS